MLPLLNRLQGKTQRTAFRERKRWQQRRRPRAADPRGLFIFGVQRSGTNMLLDMLDQSLDTWVYNEDHPKAFDNYRIKALDPRNLLIYRAGCEWVAFKSICDMHLADQILDGHPTSKSLWIFRSYKDAANSAVAKWDQTALIRLLVEVDKKRYWFNERIAPDVLNLVRGFHDGGLSNIEASMLKWYVRNLLYFELSIDQRADQVLLIHYETLVSNPKVEGQRVFDFLGLPFETRYTRQLVDSSVGKTPFPDVNPEIARLCEELYQRLLERIPIAI
ncbi:MAG: sulfotransferase [Chloroflexota bacterium]